MSHPSALGRSPSASRPAIVVDEPLLTATRVEAGYGAAPVLRGVDFLVSKGELLAIVGPNGAGKTTLAGAIAGLVPLSAGEIRFRGVDLAGAGPEARVRLGLGLVPEGRRLFQGLTVEDNLRVGAWASGEQELRGVLDLLPGLSVLLGRRAGSLPVAAQSLCALGRALAARPTLLVIDEPTLGLAPKDAEALLCVLPDVAATGCTVVMIEADAARALSVAERVVVMEHGLVVREGTPGRLLCDLGFVESYVWGSPV